MSVGERFAGLLEQHEDMERPSVVGIVMQGREMQNQ